MNTQYLTIFAIIFGGLGFAIAAFSLYLQYKIEKTRKNFYAGEDNVNLEQILSLYATKLRNLEADQTKLLAELEKLTYNSTFSLQKIGVAKFNSFGDNGGNLSFSLALLDAHNSGFVITSMFGREQNRVYTKVLEEGTSNTSLTEEEQQAIEQAIKNWKNKISFEAGTKNKNSKRR